MGKKVATNKFLADMCRQSYHTFFTEFWPIIAAESLVDTWYIRKLCEELQCLSERVFEGQPRLNDLIWNCPPGTSKSSVVSVLWQPWIWTRMPSARFISGSYSERLALDLSRKSRDVIISDKYRALFPEIVLREDQNTKSHFINTFGGMRYAVGVGGSVLGHHAHFIAVDDPIDPLGALSDLVLAEANDWMKETLSRRKVNALLTPTVLIMQRLHQDDPSGHWEERAQGKKLRWCRVPADTSWEITPPEFRQHYIDGMLDPIRLPREALDEALDTLGEDGYAGQFGQNPSPRGGAMFKVDMLNYSSSPPIHFKRGPIRYWDKAATRGGGARTAGVKLGLDDQDRLWILDVVLGQWDSGTREKRIVDTALIDGRVCRVMVEQEPAGAGKESAENTVKRVILKGLRAGMHRVTGDKEIRADPLSTYVNMGKVVLVNAHWNRTFVEEMRFFPRSKYKDQIDAASGGFSMLSKPRTMIGAL